MIPKLRACIDAIENGVSVFTSWTEESCITACCLDLYEQRNWYGYFRENKEKLIMKTNEYMEQTEQYVLHTYK